MLGENEPDTMRTLRGPTSNPHLRIDTSGPAEERYQILGRIASGAMGQIYLARVRLADGRSTEVVLKRIKPELQKDRSFQEMFYDEIRIASRMRHRNIIRLIEYGELDGSIFYSMELVPGVDLSELLHVLYQTTERPPLELVLSIGVHVLDALDYAHQFTSEEGRPLHLVHRDVSPQNVLLAFDGGVKLLDFGVTKAEGQLHKTQPGMIKGKLAYMAPEQIRGEQVDARTDLFALSVVLYEAALLHHPFPGRTDPAVITAVMRNEVPAPHEIDPRFPLHVSEILMKGMSKDASSRFETADAMRSALVGYLEMRGWGATTEGVERLLGQYFPDKLDLLARAKETRDDDLLVAALEVGSKKPINELPKLLAPPRLPEPHPFPSDEPTTDDIVPPSLRRRTSNDTGDLGELAEAVRIGLMVGRHALVELIHRGTREIHLARTDTGVPKRVALKRLSSARAADLAARSAFFEEMAAAINLAHPNLIQIFEVGQHQEEPFATMEMVEGVSLARILDLCTSRHVRMPVGVSCRIAADLCRALHYLHSRTILHCDVSKAHVIICESGDVKLTHPRLASPSSPYTAPERLTSGLAPETPASDVYSAGVILFECLSATNPFAESSVLEDTAPRLSLDGFDAPDGLEDIVGRAMARAPDRRHESARALAEDLERAMFDKRAPVTPLEVADWLRQLGPRTASRGR